MTEQAQAFLDRIGQDSEFRLSLRQHLDGLSGEERKHAAVTFARAAEYMVTLDALEALLARQRGEIGPGDENEELTEEQLASVAGGFFYHNDLLW